MKLCSLLLSYLQYFMKSYGAVMATCGARIPAGSYISSLPVMHRLFIRIWPIHLNVGLLKALRSNVIEGSLDVTLCQAKQLNNMSYRAWTPTGFHPVDPAVCYVQNTKQQASCSIMCHQLVGLLQRMHHKICTLGS